MRPPETSHSRSPYPHRLPVLSDHEFSLFQSFVRRVTGIQLGPSNRGFFAIRLARRLRKLGLRSYGEYYRIIQERRPEEMGYFLECACVHETRFFRDEEQLRFLEKEILPAWTRQADAGDRAHRVRAWSAACSTGQEPYTIAMILAGVLPAPTWRIEVLASDISHPSLETAKKGVWPAQAAQQIPSRLFKRHMIREGRPSTSFRASDALRALLRFEPINLNDVAYPVYGSYDLIFCRHVTMYFDRDTTRRVVDQLCRHLSPDGYLFMGETEVLGEGFAFRSPYPAVYSRAENA